MNVLPKTGLEALLPIEESALMLIGQPAVPVREPHSHEPNPITNKVVGVAEAGRVTASRSYSPPQTGRSHKSGGRTTMGSPPTSNVGSIPGVGSVTSQMRSSSRMRHSPSGHRPTARRWSPAR
jgi:hypothetical protein